MCDFLIAQYLINLLKKIKEQFIVYGFNLEKKEGNITFKKFQEGKKYLQELANAKAIISSAGFTLLSEALYFQKPIFAIPIKKHFEQVLNALYVQENKLGEFYTDLNENHVVEFIMNLKKYNFDKVKKWNNEKAFMLLEMLIRKETK